MSYESEVLADAPNLFWRMHETSGTNVDDISGNGLDGTLGGTTYTLGETSPITTDAGAKAIRFDGSTGDPRILKSDNSLLDFDDDFTIEMWFKLDGTPGAEMLMAMKGGSTINNGNWCVRALTGGQLQFGIRATGNRNVTMETVSADAWHHLVIGYDATTRDVFSYVDNVATDYSMPGSTAPETNSGQLIVAYDSVAKNFDGWICELALYKGIILDATRVEAHYLAAISGGGGGPIDAKRMQMMP